MSSHFQHAEDSPVAKNSEAPSSIIQSFLTPVTDAAEFLDVLTGEAYSTPSEGPFSSSIGAHMRHVLDHYHAIMLGFEAGKIDYNQRSRLSALESDIALAKQSWSQIKTWLMNLSDCALDNSVDVSTEHNQVVSTVGRELSFVSSHAVHHFAFMKQLAFALGYNLSKDVGVAPATLKNQRELAVKN